MSWSGSLMAALDDRAVVVATARGPVQLAREGSGPPVVVSHGGPGGFDLALSWCRQLRDAGCELLAPSRPGYLRTPLTSGRTPAAQADLYAAMLDARDIERATIVGFSSGGPSAVHFAARHPDRTTALLLEAAILLPFSPPINAALQRAVLTAAPAAWLRSQIVRRNPGLVAKFSVAGMSAGLDKEQKAAAVEWITSDPTRLAQLAEISACTAAPRYRSAEWKNDQVNQARLAPLPFTEVAAPTLIAHGANEGIVPVEHSATAADRIAGSELILVEEGHHAPCLSPGYGPVARRQLQLAHL
jgi:pimeloyl-ACP methyl ester carboxylesterase